MRGRVLSIYIYIADRGIFSKKKLKYLDDNKINLD